MTENSIKKHTLYVMGGVAALLLLWASFGGRGDGNPVAISAAEVHADTEEAAMPIHQADTAGVDEAACADGNAVVASAEVPDRKSVV